MSELSGILEELRKLNKSMEQVLCFQKLQAKMWEAKRNAANTRLGELAIDAQLEGEGVPSDVVVSHERRAGAGTGDSLV